MVQFLREMSVPKLSALILRWMFYLARFLGVLCFRIKSTTNDQVTMEESGPWWKWSMTILRVGCLGFGSSVYFAWIVSLNDFSYQLVHIVRIFVNISCHLCIVRVHFFQGKECTQLVNRFLQVFEKVRSLSQRKRMGFGGLHELVLLILTLVCVVYHFIFMCLIFLLRHKVKTLHIWIADVFIAIGDKLLLHIGFYGYLALGLLYADLNGYVRTQFRSQLESLEEQPTPRKLRRARKSLDKCLSLYEDIQSLTSVLQRIYDLPLLFGLGLNCSNIAAASFSAFIKLELGWSWLWSNTMSEILGMLLLTLAVQRAVVQFGVIHSLMLDNCYLSEDKEWQTKLDLFFTHLKLYEFRVRPLGLFNVSNELLVVFLSALVTYTTVVIQYGIQIKALSLSNL